MNKLLDNTEPAEPTELQDEALDAVNGGYVVTQDLQDWFRKNGSGETRFKPENKDESKDDGKNIVASSGSGSI